LRVASLSRMKPRMSSAASSSFHHCSLYSVTGKRPSRTPRPRPSRSP
jgi:hypothetical protein